MPCSELGLQLEAFIDGELTPADSVFVESHLRTCTSCAAHVTEMQRLRADLTLAHRSGPHHAPAHLRQSVAQMLSSERTTLRNKRIAQVTAVALAASWLTAAGISQYRQFQRRLFIEDAALRHAHQFPLEVNGDELDSFFGGKFEYHVSVPRFGSATAAGGRLLNVRDRQAAYIQYRPSPSVVARPSSVGLFVFGDKPGDIDVGPFPDSAFDESHGFRIASWRDGELVYQLVTDLDPNEMRALLDSMPRRNGTPPVQAQPANLQWP